MKLDRFRREEPPLALPMPAIIDVLFLMIIFLVLGANFDLDDGSFDGGHGRFALYW